MDAMRDTPLTIYDGRRMSEQDGTGARAGWVYLVGAGPGDPELITVRGARLLESADVVLHDELIDAALLSRCGAGAEVIAVGKRGSDRESKQAKQDALTERMLAFGQQGKSVVRLKGGDPFLFGRGAEEVNALVEAGLPFEVVPGVSSPVGATAYAGITLTHREHASSVTFLTAVKRDASSFDWSELHGLSGTLCVFMGTRRLATIARGLMIDAGRTPETPAAVVASISFPHQRTVVGTLANIADRAIDAGVGSPSLLVVGDVVGLREQLRWFDKRPLFGKRVLVTRPAHQYAPTAKLLRQRGAQPISFPTIAIQAPPEPERVTAAVQALASYDLVVFTSDNGVRWFHQEIQRQDRDARAFGSALVASIGPATAAGLASRGLHADIMADTFVAEALADSILEKMGDRAKGARALLPRALVARSALPDALRAAGMHVDVVPVYETVSVADTDDAAQRREQLVGLLDNADVVLLTSSSTVQNLCALLGDDAASMLSSTSIASIGPITTATAVALGLSVDVSASVSTSVGLVDALEAWLEAAR
jgi:uroporphyrinogen III methyltransferase/synthase